MVAGTARWASQHYRSWISHGFQKLPTYIYIYIYTHLSTTVFMHVYACVRPQVFTATPRCTSPLANSPLSRKGAGEGRRESLPSSRKGKGVIIRGSYSPSIPSISNFFCFLFIHPFLSSPITLSIHGNTREIRCSSNCLPFLFYFRPSDLWWEYAKQGKDSSSPIIVR